MVEGARLEIVWAFMRLGGSNPLASATTPLGRFFSDSDLRCESSRFRQFICRFGVFCISDIIEIIRRLK